jgi:hypothetical protein
MKRYELVKVYPGSPDVGTIVVPKQLVVWDGYETMYESEDGHFTFFKELIEGFPEFWKDADRDKRTMSERMRDFLDSPEGQEAIERFGEEDAKAEAQAKRDYERFCRMVDHTGLENLIDKIVQKYNSDEYVKKEFRMGYEPREVLKSQILEYFEKHGEETQLGVNIFMDCNYRIGKYFVGIMYGQGSYIKIQTENNVRLDEINGI